METNKQAVRSKLSQFHGKRKAVQLATLLLIALIPATGLFRIDLTTASFTILDRQIWWSNFPLVFGLALVLATAPIITYMTIGTVWCGWACPQNLLSEWANNLTHKFLGKRASVDVDSAGLQVAAAKNKAINWIILALTFLGASMVLAIIPFLFFFSPSEVWSFVTLKSSAQLSTFMQRLYYFAVFLIFVDIAVIRYFFCDYACVYRIGQRIFKTQDALHVAYDATRSGDCTKCNYCATSCITGIQPTRITVYDSCINCAECIDACNRLHAKSGTHGLLRFEVGEKGERATWREMLRDVLSRFNYLVGAFFVAGIAMMVYGILSQKPEPVQVPLAERLKFQQRAEVCSSRCAPQQSSCKSGNMAACYLMTACKCECYLEQDPANPSANEWRQCVQNNKANAESATKGSGGK